MLIYVTRKIPEAGLNMLHAAGHEVDVSEKDGVLSKKELTTALAKKEYDAVLCLLTDTIDADVFDAAPNAKIFANYAVGYDNIDLAAAKERDITITNTPDVLTDTVAEYAFSLILAVAKRIPEADRFTRGGKYEGWAPELFLGSDLKGKTLGVLGAGRIGSGVAVRAKRGLDMNVVYYDIERNKELEGEIECTYKDKIEEVLTAADVVTVHVPLLESTKHLINTERLALMKETAYLINTSRGQVIDEAALVEALKSGTIRAAGLDVFEDEPKLAAGLAQCDNVVITPHIASATDETRGKMSEMAAESILDVLAGETPEHKVPLP